MGNAISFRLNPKNESDKKILAWLEKKSSQPGYLNQTEAIKKAILTAIEDERKENREKSIEDWISEAILLSREEFIKRFACSQRCYHYHHQERQERPCDGECQLHRLFANRCQEV